MARIPGKRVALCMIGLIPLAIGGAYLKRNWSEGLDTNLSGEDRVARARNLKNDSIRLLFESAKISYPSPKILLRAYKREAVLELWAANDAKSNLKLLRTYKIAGQSGELGAKRKEGDLQVPEGLYYIDRFNHLSRFRLSLGINYPNASDRIRGDRKSPGSDIFIHGNTCSIGCLAMTDEIIDEIFLIALDAKNKGQKKIPVYIFPFKLSTKNLQGYVTETTARAMLWKELAPFDTYIDAHRKVPKYRVTKSGAYKMVE